MKKLSLTAIKSKSIVILNEKQEVIVKGGMKRFEELRETDGDSGDSDDSGNGGN